MRKIYILSVLLFFIVAILSFSKAGKSGDNLDNPLYTVLHNQGFTGEIQQQPEIKPGRKSDKRKVEAGRLIFFDKGLGLHLAGFTNTTNNPLLFSVFRG